MLARYLQLIGLRLRARTKIDPPPEFLGPITAVGAPGVALVTCAMNRTENLLRAIPSWLIHEEIDDILIVDWGSDFPVLEALTQNGIVDPRIQVIEVVGVDRWVLSYAFNVGFRLSRREKILKVDADIVLSDNFFRTNRLVEHNQFIAGNWRNVDKSQGFVNGFFFAPKRALADVGGFNEHITTYGWDDDDLYQRLEAQGYTRQDVAPNAVTHLDHADVARTGIEVDDKRTARDDLLTSTSFMIQRNRLMVAKLPPWSRADRLLPLSLTAAQPGLTRLVARQPATTVPRAIYAAATEEMLVEMISWEFGPIMKTIPKTVFDRVMEHSRSDLFTLFQRAAGSPREIPQSPRKSRKAPALIGLRRRIFIDAQHGLGNRMRAIGSAAAIARAAGRELVIVWQPDVHCDCRFTDLYDYDGAIENRSFIEEFDGVCVFNYMGIEGGEKGKEIKIPKKSDLYIRSAFILNHPASDWDSENAFLKSLTPVQEVVKLVNLVRGERDLGVHVRMEAGKGRDQNPYDQPKNNWSEEDHSVIQLWREKSHYSRFIARINGLLNVRNVSSIYLAADHSEPYAVFREMYGEKLAYLPREVFDRSTDQLRFALADAILLSKSTHFLCSSWSSFSELALRLAVGKPTVEWSGLDF